MLPRIGCNRATRSKGRTNIELREQFILADGVSQSMAAFRPRTPRSNTNTPPSTGPITKVRERSVRSVPMSTGVVAGRASRSSYSAGTPDSLSDNEAASGLGSRYRKPSVPRSTYTPGGSRPGSRPGSRTGSKPPSRHGSNLSLDSTDDVTTPSRIPMRKVTNTRTSTARTTGNKLGVSTPNGASSRPRTPTGFATPASGRCHSGAMYRTSSIPTLSSVTPLVRYTGRLELSNVVLLLRLRFYTAFGIGPVEICTKSVII
ncbi:Microtubule-actin cross-linking factor 1 [Eumeta japonica]|uniref:Microtubule-actin cross-linking factor 1 n=1 Tax=Eumeta variegata TaxID=151549 RepID=A0A4C1U3A6_EUMVA|nr:Microtubule-actin cross-linking factor 1 [Eumeta japonica]